MFMMEKPRTEEVKPQDVGTVGDTWTVTTGRALEPQYSGGSDHRGDLSASVADPAGISAPWLGYPLSEDLRGNHAQPGGQTAKP